MGLPHTDLAYVRKITALAFTRDSTREHTAHSLRESRPMSVLIAVLLASLCGFWIYHDIRNYRASTGLVQEWAKANRLLYLREGHKVPPMRLWTLPKSRQDATTYVDVLDEATRRVRHVWLILHGSMWRDMTLDDIEVLGWDDEG